MQLLYLAGGICLEYKCLGKSGTISSGAVLFLYSGSGDSTSKKARHKPPNIDIQTHTQKNAYICLLSPFVIICLHCIWTLLHHVFHMPLV